LKELQEIVSDQDLDKVWGSASFGISRRDVIKYTLLKRASRYHCGHTARVICTELGLITPKAENLTAKGGRYLWAAFSEGSNF